MEFFHPSDLLEVRGPDADSVPLDDGVGGVELMRMGITELVQLGVQLGVGSQVVAPNGEGLPLDVLLLDWGACPISFTGV